jgi:PilZ domain-containing protein
MSREKRQAERIDMLGDMPGAASVAQPVTIKELSRTGALIESSFPLQIDSLHLFRLMLGQNTVVVQGRIAHCRINEMDQDRVVYAAGVDFVELTPAATKALTAFLEDVKAGRQARTGS